MFKNAGREIRKERTRSRGLPPRTNVASTETRPTSLDKGERAQRRVRGNLSANNRDELSAGDIVAGRGGKNAVGRDSGFGNLSFHELFISLATGRGEGATVTS